ncbi:hypothetical protein P175DRAFT_017814 [Aspergillus ochraceoroseus IBT 24754]|uniref:Uncharacterized protein n=1 Tax=Aspergillus ochraceoroseus IBT 24754 TaxID=1392256 RepID=A0A2T5M6B4_9EURO|nr:uncharacterized protein P175DRAFT_017814 [Aspergillus ochraceoroseus IBT 24754]PTU24046.1 hypothetical protein P175DRAFT_017814 [Aspergillus ochraceoroseus IBT 24754]
MTSIRSQPPPPHSFKREKRHWREEHRPTLCLVPSLHIPMMLSLFSRRMSRVSQSLPRFTTTQRWSSSISQRPGSDRVRFPGAVNSKFTTDMSFVNPSNTPSIPTYRVMDSDGVLVDKSRKPPNVSNEQVLTWYKNMLTGRWGKEQISK